jgi:uncharacterized membrane protein
MEPEIPEVDNRWSWPKVFQYFLQGLIILAPITITLWAVISLFNYIDNILPNLFQQIVPFPFLVDDDGTVRKIPGLGFILVVVIVVIVGWVSSSYIVSKLVDFFGQVLEKTPGIKLIYTSVKDLLEAFAGNKRKFDKPVLVNVDGNDVWRLGFMTKPDCEAFGLSNHVVVYLPHSYALSGVVYLVPVEKIKIVANISSTEAMKFAVSGGVAEITH